MIMSTKIISNCRDEMNAEDVDQQENVDENEQNSFIEEADETIENVEQTKSSLQ